MPKQRPNRIGLTLSQYRRNFAGWQIPLGWIVRASNEAWSFEESEKHFERWAEGEKIRPTKQRALGFDTLQRILKRRVAEVGIELAQRRLTPEARLWLEKMIPETARYRPKKFPHYCDVVEMKIEGSGSIEPEGSVIAPGYEERWEREQAEKNKG